MNKFLGSLLNNLWALIGSTLNLALVLCWYLDEPGWEPLVGTYGAGIVFLGSVYAYIFYWPANIPKLELSHEASNGTLPPTPPQFRMSNKEHWSEITWKYTFFIRNNSSYPAFRVKFHLRDEFAGIQFPNKDKTRPIELFRFNEKNLQTVERLHKDEPVKPLEKVAFEAEYRKSVFASRDEAMLTTKRFFPTELSNMEILVEYQNEDEDTFYTLFTKTDKDTWKNKRLKYKPLNYTRLSKILKFGR